MHCWMLLLQLSLILVEHNWVLTAEIAQDLGHYRLCPHLQSFGSPWQHMIVRHP